MSLDNEQSKVIQGRFHLTRKLGAGSFGEIFEAKDLKTGKLYACKAESLRTKHPQLRLEYQIYRALQNSKSFVRVWGYVTHYNHQIMIMDKLGDSLEQLFTLCGRKFSIRCVCAIAIQILTRIEELHKHNYLHRDIKPDNFLIGSTPNGELQCKEAAKIYMIDLGLGKVWKEGGRHIPEKHGKRLIGTPRYASISTHFGHEQSRRDDLESLGYMLMYFAHGQLPWQGLRGQTKEEKYQKIGHKKRDTRLSELCAGYPEEFRQYLSATQKLSFQADPPYEQYRQWFRNVLDRHRTIDVLYDFDWQNRNMTKPGKSSAKQRRSTRHQTQHQHQHHAVANHNQQTQPPNVRRNLNNKNPNLFVNNLAQTPMNAVAAAAYNKINNVSNRGGHATQRHHASTRRATHNTHNAAPIPPNTNAHLALPYLGQQAQHPQSTTPIIAPNVGQNQFSNYIDRYQRCRNMLSQQQNNTKQNMISGMPRNNNGITMVEIGNNNSNSNSPNNNSNSPNNHNINVEGIAAHAARLENILFRNGNNNIDHRFPLMKTQSAIQNQSKTFVNEYQELVANYKKLEASNIESKQQNLGYKQQIMEYKRQIIEYKRHMQGSDTNYSKLKKKCNNYVYQINELNANNRELQKKVQQLTGENNFFKNSTMNQPAQKRRKLNPRRGNTRL